ncbi:MAG: TonB-dependent receptor [Geitlerinemataceae cyanobacterium]
MLLNNFSGCRVWQLLRVGAIAGNVAFLSLTIAANAEEIAPSVGESLEERAIEAISQIEPDKQAKQAAETEEAPEIQEARVAEDREENPAVAREDSADDPDDDGVLRLTIEGIRNQPVFGPFRQERPLSDSSRPVYVIPREQIDAQGAATVEEALRYTPGILAEGTSGGQLGSTSSQFMRGGSTSQTLILLDGRPLNDLGFSGGFDLAEFTTDFVERIEVFPGGSSALYGSGGVGGTINIVTQEPTEDPEYSVRVGAGVFGYNQQVLRARGSEGDIGWVVGYNRTYAENDFPFELESIDLSDSRDNAEANYNNLNLKLMADIDDRNSLTFSTLYLTRDIRVPGGYPTGEGSLGQFNSLSPDANQYTEDILLDLRWDSQLDAEGDSVLTARAYTDILRYTFRDPRFSRDEIDRDTFGFQVQHAWQLADAHRLTYGLDFRTTTAENQTTSFFDGSTSENYDDNIDQGALFALYNVDIAENLSANLGLRQEFNSLENGSFTSPSAGILWNINDNTALRANYARSFNAPLISNLEGLAAFGVVGEPDLEPERGNSFDIGIDHAIGDVALLRLTGFVNRIEETIAFQFGSPSTYINIGETETIGLEAAVDVKLADNWFAFANFTLNETQIIEDSTESNEGNELSFRDADSLNLGVAYSDVNGLYVGAILRYVSEFFVDNANTEELGDYITLDLKAQVPLAEGVVLNASLNNLFDEQYELFPGFPAQGINGRASVRWSF